MSETGTGKVKLEDEHLTILRRIELSQNTAARIAARAEKDGLLWRVKQDGKVSLLEEAVFGSKRESGLKKRVESLTTRQHIAMGGIIVIASCLAWVGNILKTAMDYMGHKR